MRGVTPTSIEMSRISFSARPSGRFLCTAMRSRMIDFSSCVERELDGRAALLGVHELLLGGALGRRRGVLLEDRLPRPPWSRPGARACPRPGWRRRAGSRARRGSARAPPGRPAIVSKTFFSLPTFAGELALQRAELLDLRVGDVERVEDLGLGDLVGARLDHQDRLLGAGDDQVEVRAALCVRAADPPRSGLTTKLPSTLPIRTAPTGVGNGMSEIISAAEAPFIARMS